MDSLKEDITFKDITFAGLNQQKQIQTFTCGATKELLKLDNFLKTQALRHRKERIATTTLLYYKNKLAGFFSLCAAEIQIQKENISGHPKEISTFYPVYPALRICRIAVNLPFQKSKCKEFQHVGTFMMRYIFGLARELNNNLGVRFLVVDPKQDSIDWYTKKLGFRKLNESKTPFLYFDLGVEIS